MYPELTFFDNPLDRLDADDAGIRDFFGAPRREAAVENGENDRVEQPFVLTIERTIYKNMARFLDARLGHNKSSPVVDLSRLAISHDFYNGFLDRLLRELPLFGSGLYGALGHGFGNRRVYQTR